LKPLFNVEILEMKLVDGFCSNIEGIILLAVLNYKGHPICSTEECYANEIKKQGLNLSKYSMKW